MKYKNSLAIWGIVSPIASIVLLLLAFNYKTDNLFIAFSIGMFFVFSILASLACYGFWSKSDYFFKTLDQLEKEIDDYKTAKQNYVRLLETTFKKQQ